MAGDRLQLLEALWAEGAVSSDQEDWRLRAGERMALAGNSWFAGLPSATRHDLLRAIHVRSYESGETIFASGEPVRAWMVCVGGAVRIATTFTASGRSLALQFLRPGQWFGDLPAPGRSGHTHEACANGLTRIGEVDRLSVSSLLDKHLEFRAALLDWQSMRLASVYRLLEEHATLNLSARMARHLHRLTKDHGMPHGGGEIRIGLSLVQSDLAALVGCSRQRANEELRELTRQELVRFEKGSLVITDRRRLQCLVENDCSGNS
jgi:CRP-like cAMP-binding protein